MEVAVCWEIKKESGTLLQLSLNVGVFKINHIRLILNYLGSIGTLIFYVRLRKADFCGIMEGANISPIA